MNEAILPEPSFRNLVPPPTPSRTSRFAPLPRVPCMMPQQNSTHRVSAHAGSLVEYNSPITGRE